MNKTIITCLMLAILFACTNKNDSQQAKNERSVTESITEVDTIHLKYTDFKQQLICNGKLEAMARSEISFPADGIITKILVHNGNRVTKGQILAITDKDEKQQLLSNAEKEKERADIMLADKLISLGYDGVNDNVPADVMKRAKITSGFYNAAHQLTMAQKALADCELRAPFSGRIADMQCQPYQKADKFGLLINDSFFNVEFSVLESELKWITVGQAVTVTPFIDEHKAFSGTIQHINPTVNDKGLVNISARIKNTDNILLDGMNIRVTVEKTIPDMLIVPKSAVVERDGYNVVFITDNSTAVWTYVDILQSNMTHHAITGCARKETKIMAGQAVIVSDNQNLADGTRIKIGVKE